MSYSQKNGLPFEKANKLNHVDIPKNDLINKLLDNMRLTKNIQDNLDKEDWQNINIINHNFDYIVSVDGSISFVEDKLNGIKGVFVKIGTLILRQDLLNYFKTQDSIDPRIKENIFKNAFTNSVTFFPLSSNMSYKNNNLYNSIRHLIFDSLALENNGNLETLKFLIYKKWQNTQNHSEFFECPHCNEKNRFPYNLDSIKCNKCLGEILITDFLGFHKNFADDCENLSQKIATDYMLVSETLTMFNIIKSLSQMAIEKDKKEILNNFLFLKDGPLSLNGIYSKLVNYINSYLEFCDNNKLNINLIGQEKTGTFVDYFETNNNSNQYLILSNDIIRKNISPETINSTKSYGRDTMYGQKIFINFSTHKLVMSFNNKGKYTNNPQINNFVNFEQNLSYLKTILSYNYANSLMPIMMVNDRTSLSLNPTKNILEEFIIKFFN